ncbi:MULTISPECIES: hypothetical protein [Pseudomonadaceae]|uniref:hypothetical protein n=1 Tax=Pseudomonadaceae TaxID=135621 RepID=UPI002167D001|nr:MULTISPECIES: hypothetical protein [Pseudomonadaceae]MCS4063730.1 hypothetical protein [Pseudomonas putida]
MTNALNLGNVTLPGSNYLSIYGFNVPVKSGLEGLFLFGDGSAHVARNYAPGKANATVVGAPQSFNGYTTFSDSGYLETGIAETAEMTIITICRDSTGIADPRPGFVGNYFDLATGGVAIFPQSETQFRAQTVKNKANDYSTVLAKDTIASYAALALRVRNNAPSVMKNLVTGVEVSSTSSLARTVDGSRTIQIGRIPNDGFKGLNDQMMVLIFSRSILDAELSSLIPWSAGYGTSHGINIYS